MSVLDQERFDKVIEVGKKAVVAFKENNLTDFEKYSEEAWMLVPEPKNSWNQIYNMAKSFFKQNLEHNKLDKAHIWLDRMVDNNNALHHSDTEVEFYQGVYQFEIGNLEQAYADWKSVVKEAGYRYFESEKPEYLKFYRDSKKS